jgi:hypothetical protein
MSQRLGPPLASAQLSAERLEAELAPGSAQESALWLA